MIANRKRLKIDFKLQKSCHAIKQFCKIAQKIFPIFWEKGFLRNGKIYKYISCYKREYNHTLLSFANSNSNAYCACIIGEKSNE